MWKMIFAALGALSLSACSSSDYEPRGDVPDLVKVGKPYSISGHRYYPKHEPTYDVKGVASWYGPGFHGKKTANGETFDENALTAAHTTLPMPSLVRVTNLDNGRQLVVRVNDRGPFVDDRIIDLSRASAKELGVTGLAKVRVQYLDQDTQTYWAENGLSTRRVQYASARKPYEPSQAKEAFYDGEVLQPDVIPVQRGSAAPLVSINSQELASPIADKPSYLTSNAPIQENNSGWSLISSANAAENAPAGSFKVAQAYDTPQAVQLFDHNGRSVDKNAPIRSMPQPAPREAQPQLGGVQPLLAPSTGGAIRSSAIVNNSTTSRPSYAPDGWYIQAGSFSSRNNANALVNKLSSFATPNVTTVDVHGRTWHRVRLGPYSDYREAETAMQQVRARGASGATLVRN